MYSTAVEFKSTTSIMEKCEADFIAVVAGAPVTGEAPVQILFGEAETGMEFNADDVRKLGKLADAVPSDLAVTFFMFTKTETFTNDEVQLAGTLNSNIGRGLSYCRWTNLSLTSMNVRKSGSVTTQPQRV